MPESISSPSVILVRPQEEGNIGATARAMANMGLDSLVLVDPVATIGRTARAFAVSAGEILDHARVTSSLGEALGPFRRVVGTTSARTRDLPVPTLLPAELPELLAGDPEGTSTALVFGPEASGLTNEEMAVCSVLVRVPCTLRQPTLNLGQAVLILAYELHMAALRRKEALDPRRLPSEDSEDLPASTGEIDGLFTQLLPLLDRIGFLRDDTAGTVLRDLRRMASHGLPTHREVRLMRGICRRARNALDRVD